MASPVVVPAPPGVVSPFPLELVKVSFAEVADSAFTIIRNGFPTTERGIVRTIAIAIITEIDASVFPLIMIMYAILIIKSCKLFL
jgi:hypothetical protein